MEQFYALLPVIIGGVFTVVGALLSRQSAHVRVELVDGKLVQAASLPLPMPPPLARPTGIRWGAVALDTGIIMLLTALGGFIVGLASMGKPMEEMLPIIGLSNIILATVGFTIAGARNPQNRWLHVLLVGVALWLTSVHNVLLGMDISGWFFAIPVIAVTAAIGTGISYLFARSR